MAIDDEEVVKGSQAIPERPDYEKELIDIIKNESVEVIREKMDDYHENDIANVLKDITVEERKKLYDILDDEKVSDIFTYVEEDINEYVTELGPEKAADIIENMDADDAVDVLESLEGDNIGQIKNFIDSETRQDIELILSYDDDKIGSKMTTNFVYIERGFSVKQAMKSLIGQAAENDNISTLYVLEEDKSFYGAIDLKDLIMARDYQQLEDLIVTSYPYVFAEEKTVECIEELKDYSEDSIPVLDNDKKMIGVITSQDIVEAIDEELGDDYAKLAGLTSEEDLNEPFVESIKKRLPWLVLLLFLGMVVSTVVGMFEEVVMQIALVVSFQSLILDMAGNVGTQSLAVTIRVLMDENLTAKEQRGLVKKEVKIGFVNGAFLGILSFLFIGVYIMVVKDYSPFFSFAASACIGLSLVVAMVASSVVGTLTPIFFKKIKIDPAVASGPLITTINDLIAVVFYYGLVWILLINVLHLGG